MVQRSQKIHKLEDDHSEHIKKVNLGMVVGMWYLLWLFSNRIHIFIVLKAESVENILPCFPSFTQHVSMYVVVFFYWKHSMPTGVYIRKWVSFMKLQESCWEIMVTIHCVLGLARRNNLLHSGWPCFTVPRHTLSHF